MPNTDKRSKTYIGEVVRGPFGRGSKSERPSIFLSTRYGDFVLRGEEGHPFFNKEIDDLVGKRVRASGIRHRHVFVVQDWKELAPRKGKN